MARRKVVLQEPISITSGTYAQPEKYAIQVGNAKTAVVILDIYNIGSSGTAVLEIETASRTDTGSFTEPATSGLWVTPTGATFTLAGGTDGAAILSFDELGDVLRWNLSSNGISSPGIDFSITVYLIDNQASVQGHRDEGAKMERALDPASAARGKERHLREEGHALGSARREVD